MPLEAEEIKPLTPVQITRALEDKGYSQARWARERGFTPWQLRAVIHRNPEVVYQEIRELLAEFLGVPIAAVGREPARVVSADETAQVAA